MFRKLVLAAAILAFATFAVPKASADSFALNIDFCSSPCLGGGGGGTVTISLGTGTGAGGNGAAVGDVKFDVELSDPLHFHQTSGLDAFNFNYSGGATTLSIASITSGYNTTLLSGQHEDGAGTFSKTVTYGTQPGVDGQSLVFVIHGTAGALTLANFEVISVAPGGGNTFVDFAANVSNGTCTGLIGGGNGTAATSPSTLNSGGSCTVEAGVPEPTSVLLLGTALLFAGKFLKAKLLVS